VESQMRIAFKKIREAFKEDHSMLFLLFKWFPIRNLSFYSKVTFALTLGEPNPIIGRR
jgi:hypothetical protein